MNKFNTLHGAWMEFLREGENEGGNGGGSDAGHDPMVTQGSDSAGTPKEADTEADEGFDAESLISEEDYEDAPEPKDPTVQEVPAESEEEETTTTTQTQENQPTATPQSPTVEAPQVETQTPAQPAATTQPEAPAPQLSAETIQAQMQEFMQKGEDLLASKVYVLDEETIEALDTQPSQVLPKLAAKLHMQIMTAAVTQMANLMPSMLAIHQERSTSLKATEDKFYGDFPELAPHKETVLQLARAYRQANPKTPADEAAKQIAAMAKIQLKLFGPTPQQPPAPGVPTPTAVRGGNTAPPASSQPKSEWDELVNYED